MCARPKKAVPDKQQADSKRRAPKRGKSVSSASDMATEEPTIGAETTESDADCDAQQFIRGLAIRGEAVDPETAESGALESGDEKLPSGVTHKITRKDEQGLPIEVKRERFSAY